MKTNLVYISLVYLHLTEQFSPINHLYIDFVCVIYNYRDKKNKKSIYLKINGMLNADLANTKEYN